jgi:hypothetical protein
MKNTMAMMMQMMMMQGFELGGHCCVMRMC